MRLESLLRKGDKQVKTSLSNDNEKSMGRQLWPAQCRVAELTGSDGTETMNLAMTDAVW